MNEGLKLTAAPHIRTRISIARIRLDVIIALIPAVAAAVWSCGLRGAYTVLTALAASVIGDLLFEIITKREKTIKNLESVVIGLLTGLLIPSAAPLWAAAVGGLIAAVIFKQLIGLAGRSYIHAAAAAYCIVMLILRDGSLAYSGEIMAAAVTLGFIYLVVRGVIQLRIPLMYVLAFSVLTYLFGDSEQILDSVIRSNILLCAVFLAPAYASSPAVPTGRIVFGIGCGVLTFVLGRFNMFGAEAAAAVIVMNVLSPIIERFSIKTGRL